MAVSRARLAAVGGLILAALTVAGPTGRALAGEPVTSNGATRVCRPSDGGGKVAATAGELRHALSAPPAALDDGWPVSTLAAEGLRQARIAAMLDAIDTWRFKKVDSVLIARRGKLVLEAYFNGFDRETRHDTRSAFKSVASTLVGIAIDRGLIAGVDRPVVSLFPGHPSIAGWSARKRRMTLAHLLTMTAGFDAEENFGIGPWREIDMWRSEDWIAFALEMPMAKTPGIAFSYNTPTAVLLGGAIARAAGETVPEFAARELFAPLGITRYCWTLSPRGQAMTGGNFYMRPRDMAKIGQVFLDGGTWNGRRIVSEDWVAAATAPRVDAAGPRDIGLEPMIKGYGYQWWTRRWRPSDRRFDSFHASGNGGQKILVFPGLEMVVVFTGSNYSNPLGHKQARELLRHYIFLAIAD